VRSGSIGLIVQAGLLGPRPLPGLSLELRGSPAVGPALLLITSALEPRARLTLHDLSGHAVRSWREDEFERRPEGLGVSWDGHDAGGRALPAGLYVARLESGGRTATERVPFLR
jgi:hypothetical protein